MLKSGSQAWFRSVLIQSCTAAQNQSTWHWLGLGSSQSEQSHSAAVLRHHRPLGARISSFSLSSEMLNSMTLDSGFDVTLQAFKHHWNWEEGRLEHSLISVPQWHWVWALPYYPLTQFPPGQLGLCFILQSTFSKCMLQILNWPSSYWVYTLHLVAASALVWGSGTWWSSSVRYTKIGFTVLLNDAFRTELVFQWDLLMTTSEWWPLECSETLVQAAQRCGISGNIQT